MSSAVEEFCSAGMNLGDMGGGCAVCLHAFWAVQRASTGENCTSFSLDPRGVATGPRGHGREDVRESVEAVVSGQYSRKPLGRWSPGVMVGQNSRKPLGRCSPMYWCCSPSGGETDLLDPLPPFRGLGRCDRTRSVRDLRGCKGGCRAGCRGACTRTWPDFSMLDPALRISGLGGVADSCELRFESDTYSGKLRLFFRLEGRGLPVGVSFSGWWEGRGHRSTISSNFLSRRKPSFFRRRSDCSAHLNVSDTDLDVMSHSWYGRPSRLADPRHASSGMSGLGSLRRWLRRCACRPTTKHIAVELTDLTSSSHLFMAASVGGEFTAKHRSTMSRLRKKKSHTAFSAEFPPNSTMESSQGPCSSMMEAW
mmetsp:Transcript_51619/g.129503  ORF Transcript_51619/g.129503 Transcript_51619/m.129503 type:complete len:366 (-) Transcript_51619:302-1399(-)